MRVEKLYKVKQENAKMELNTHFFGGGKKKRIIVSRPHRMKTSSLQKKKKMLLVLNVHNLPCTFIKFLCIYKV